MKLGRETSSFRIAQEKEESARLQKGPVKGGKRKGVVAPRQGAGLLYGSEEAGTFNWNPDVEPETGKPIYGPDHKDQENSF
jgi:hypothetical protein